MSSNENTGWLWLGRVIGFVIQVGVMVWAAVETTGALSICLWSVSGIIVAGVVVTGTRPKPSPKQDLAARIEAARRVA